MDTKWKKSKAVAGIGSFVLGMIILTGCVVMNPLTVFGDVTALQTVISPYGSYQDTETYRREVAWMLRSLIRVGAGEPLFYSSWEYSEASGATGEVIVSDGGGFGLQIGAEAEKTTEVAAEQAYAAEEAVPDELEEIWDAPTYTGEGDVAEKQAGSDTTTAVADVWTPEEIRIMAEDFHEAHWADRNILYQVKQGDKVLYDNLEGKEIGLDKDNLPLLPEDYNMLLYFDGSSVSIYRDLARVDVYGDRIYEEDGRHWRVPGYDNYPVSEGWADCRVLMAVRQVPLRYLGADGFYGDSLYSIYKDFWQQRNYLMGWGIFAAAGLLLLGLARCFRRERREAERKIGISLGKIPLEIRLAAVVLLFFIGSDLLTYLLYQLFWNLDYYSFWMTDVVLAVLVLRLFWLDFHYGQGLWQSSLTARLIRLLNTREMKLTVQKRLVRQFNRPLLLAIGTIVLCLLAGIMHLLFWGNWISWGFLIGIAGFLLLTLLLLCSAKKQKRLAADLGHLAEQIEAAYQGQKREAYELPADFQLAELAKKVAGIQDGLEKAVEERVKSERMKVELVANVSHDIKTPLTSIISYVDLLQEEENLPEELKDYVKILAQKSERLKTMVQDIFEVSKAASGQLPVHMEILDLAKLLRQTLADMAEQIEAAQAELRIQLPAEPVLVQADGQRMYRVFQNLLQNALRYSLEGSRIYLTLECTDSQAVTSLRNTSKAELDGGTDFTERFVRGDVSRTDGGSGLGLSIARSFTEACRGSFIVETIADLFVVKVTFEKRTAEPPETESVKEQE